MRVLVTGAGGFIGRRLFEGLRGDGLQVYGLVRRARRTAGMFRADLAQPESIGRLLSRLKADAIVHCAGSLCRAEGSGAEGYLNNVTTTANLLSQAIACRVKRAIFLSSNAVYGSTYCVRPEQQDRVDPRNWYGRSKLLCETLFRDNADAIATVVLRLPSVLGQSKRSGDVVTDMVGALNEGRTLTVYGQGRARRQFVDIEDLVAIVRLCLKRDFRGAGVLTVPVAGAEAATIRQLAEMLVDLRGRGEIAFDHGKSEPQDQWVDPAILRTSLGYKLKVGLLDSMKRLLRDSR